jgi:hypothetical protein
VQWNVDTGDADRRSRYPILLREVLNYTNAFEHQQEGSSIHFIAKREGDNLVLTLYEPKAQFDYRRVTGGGSRCAAR